MIMSSIRRHTAVLMVATIMGIGTATVLTAAPASAATPTVHACFVYNGYGPMAGRTIRSQAYYNGAWHNYGSKVSGPSGCAWVPIPAGYYVRAVVSFTVGSACANPYIALFQGSTGYVWSPGGTNRSVGTGYVSWSYLC